MAAQFFFRNTGNVNFSLGTNWSFTSGGASAGAAPGTGDTATFDVNSGNCTVDIGGIMISDLVFTSYANTITPTNDLIVTGGVTSNAGSVNAIAAGTIIVGGGITCTGSITGAGTIRLNGTGTWSGSGTLATNLTINTAGTISLFGTVVYGTRTLTYTAGTLSSAGSTLSLVASCTLNTSGTTWANITLSTASGTFTLSSDLNLSGTLTQSSATGVTVNGNNINISGSLSIVASGSLLGTTVFNMIGTGSISSNASSVISVGVVINTSGTITFSSGTISFSTGGSLTYTTGTTVFTGNTLSIGSTVTFNTGSCSINNLSLGDCTFTLTSNLNVAGSVTQSGASGSTLNTSALNVSGSFAVNGAGGTLGSSTINLVGTGTWSGNNPVKNNLTFNTSGTITVSGTVQYSTGTLTYSAGTMVMTSSILTVGASTTTLNTNGMSWANVTFSATQTTTLSSNLTMTGDLSFAGTGVTITINGSTLFCAGSCTVVIGTSLALGTTIVTLNGTGIISSGSGNGKFGMPMTIDTTGTITIGSFAYGDTSNPTFTYVQGGIVILSASVSLAIQGNCRMDTSGMRWNSIAIALFTLTLLSNVNVGLDFSNSSNSTINGSSFSVNVYRNLVVSSFAFLGTATIVLAGTGSWTSSAGAVSCGLRVEAQGKYTFGSSLNIGSQGRFAYVSGIVDATATTLLLSGTSMVFTDVHKVVFGGGVTFSNTATASFNRFFSGTGALPCSVRPTTTGIITITLTSPSESNFTSVQGVLMSATSPFKAMFTSINANKGANSGVIFMAQQLPQGFVDQEWVDNYWEPGGSYLKQWGQTPIGFVRNG